MPRNTDRRPIVRHASVRLLRSHVAVGLLLTGSCLTGRAVGQNDWQFPDPYFGILEIEKSHDSGAWRRYRGEVSPAPGRVGPTTGHATAGGTTGQPDQPPAQRPNRVRWRTRSRR